MLLLVGLRAERIITAMAELVFTWEEEVTRPLLLLLSRFSRV